MTIDRPITIALILFVILLLAFFFVVPEYNAFGQLRTDLSQKKAEFQAERAYYVEIDKTYNDLIARQDDIKKIDDALPSLPQNPTLGKLIYYLQKISKENGLVAKNLFLSQSSSRNAEVSTSNGIRDITFSLDLMGDYPSLEKFIISLEKSSRIFEVTNISFGSSAKPPYSFSLQIKTHSY